MKPLIRMPASKPIRVRKATGLVLRVTKPGHKTATLTPDPIRDDFPLWAILAFWPYGIAILIDYESGARVHFEPAQLKVHMPPLE